MQAAEVVHGMPEAVGTIRRIAALDRELTLETGGEVLVFALAPDCSFVLHGEPVKLRLLQPLDRASVGYRRAAEGLVAHCVRVP
jgi:hypothetical protein